MATYQSFYAIEGQNTIYISSVYRRYGESGGHIERRNQTVVVRISTYNKIDVGETRSDSKASPHSREAIDQALGIQGDIQRVVVGREAQLIVIRLAIQKPIEGNAFTYLIDVYTGATLQILHTCEAKD